GRPCGAVFAVRPRGGLQTVSPCPLPAAGAAANTIFAQILHCHGGGGAAVFSIIERKHTGGAVSMKTEGKTRSRVILIVLAAICLAVWLACGAAVFFADSPAFAMGMAGFARQALRGAGWTLLAAAAAAYCALTLRRRSDSAKTVLVCAAAILAGCAL